jgi:hypothetical protein
VELQILKNPKIMELRESKGFLEKLKDTSDKSRQNL